MIGVHAGGVPEQVRTRTARRRPAGELDLVFQALADPTRRAVVARLARGPAAVTELARPFSMALPSFVQHLDVLERAGLASSRKRGRVRTYELVPTRLRHAQDWLAAQRDLWRRRLDQLDEHLAATAASHHVGSASGLGDPNVRPSSHVGAPGPDRPKEHPA